MHTAKYNEVEFYKLCNKYINFNVSLYPITITNNANIHGQIFECHNVNTETMISISHLFKLQHINDILSLSRSMFESVVNMALLLSDIIPDVFNRYDKYCHCEEFKLINHLRNVELCPGFVDAIYNPKQIAEITDGKEKYTNIYGSTNNWCGMNMLERVQRLDRYYQPTCKMNKFFEFLYCQIYRKGSSSTHGSSMSLDLSIKLVKKSDGNKRKVFIKPITNTLIFTGFHALMNYLLSIRFLGYTIESKKEEIELYYQNELNYILFSKVNT